MESIAEPVKKKASDIEKKLQERLYYCLIFRIELVPKGVSAEDNEVVRKRHKSRIACKCFTALGACKKI